VIGERRVVPRGLHVTDEREMTMHSQSVAHHGARVDDAPTSLIRRQG
jgi:hypothetical protein